MYATTYVFADSNDDCANFAQSLQMGQGEVVREVLHGVSPREDIRGGAAPLALQDEGDRRQGQVRVGRVQVIAAGCRLRLRDLLPLLPQIGK